MPELRTPEHWDQRYRDNHQPWDSGMVCAELMARLPELSLACGSRVLEIGCGTGTNAIWLAQQGFEVLGIDISAVAVDRAQAKAKEAGVNSIHFERCDIVSRLPVTPGAMSFVYDRGCFHSVAAEDRPTFAKRVAEALEPADYWLTLTGNADEHREVGAEGPPQLAALEIVSAVESRFEILRLARSSFASSSGRMAWSCLMRKRS